MTDKWDESYLVHIETLDCEHRELFRTISEIEVDTGTLEAKAASGGAGTRPLKDLYRQARDHFRSEERLFAQHAYPEAGLHKRHHDTFLRNLAEFRDRIEAGVLTMSADLKQFLRDWLVDHITKIDMRYSSFLREAGVAASTRPTAPG